MLENYVKKISVITEKIIHIVGKGETLEPALGYNGQLVEALFSAETCTN